MCIVWCDLGSSFADDDLHLDQRVGGRREVRVGMWVKYYAYREKLYRTSQVIQVDPAQSFPVQLRGVMFGYGPTRDDEVLVKLGDYKVKGKLDTFQLIEGKLEKTHSERMGAAYNTLVDNIEQYAEGF